MSHLIKIYAVGKFSYFVSGIYSVKEWTGMDFASSTKAAEHRTRQKGNKIEQKFRTSDKRG